MELPIKFSAIMANFLVTALVRNGVATDQQGSRVLADVADEMEKLTADAPEEAQAHPEWAMALRCAKREAAYLRARSIELIYGP